MTLLNEPRFPCLGTVAEVIRGERAVQRVEARFSVAQMVAGYLEVYRRVLR